MKIPIPRGAGVPRNPIVPLPDPPIEEPLPFEADPEVAPEEEILEPMGPGEAVPVAPGPAEPALPGI